MARIFVAIIAIALIAALGARPPRVSATPKPRVVHVFVALADNAHQGIVIAMRYSPREGTAHRR